MRKFLQLTICVLFLGGVVRAGEAAPEKEIFNPITKVSLFKNGLAHIQRHFTTSEPGEYRLRFIPMPVHGTFWIDSRTRMDAVSGLRRVPYDPAKHAQPQPIFPYHARSSIPYPGYDLVQALLGKEVVITLRSPETGSRIYSGIVLDSPSGRLLLRTAKGLSFISQSEIVAIEASEYNQPEQTIIEEPFMNLVVRGEGRAEGRMEYLDYGITWAPSYHIDLSDSSNLRIELKADIRNEIEDLSDVECELITGFPNVQFSSVPSLITPGLNLQDFFNPTQQGRRRMSQVMEQAATQRAINGPSVIRAYIASGIPQISDTGGDGADLFYKNIGKISLKKDETTSIQLEFANAQYETIVEWSIPDRRDQYGNVRGRAPQDDNGESDIWDAIRFRNPFTSPLTTAPVTFFKKKQFAGQSQSSFVSPNEECSIRVTKALSVRGSDQEFEEQGGRERFQVFGSTYEKRKVKGEVKVKNYRNIPIKLIANKSISGAVDSADQGAEKTLLADGIDSLNQVWRVRWTLTLQPNEEKTLSYAYTVVVNP